MKETLAWYNAMAPGGLQALFTDTTITRKCAVDKDCEACEVNGRVYLLLGDLVEFLRRDDSSQSR